MGTAYRCRRAAPSILLLGFLLVALAAPAQPGAAPSAALDVSVVLGFSDTFRPGRWTPVTVTVSNRGAALAGTLEVRSTDGDEFRRRLFPVIQRRALEIGRDARKRFHFTVYLESVAHPLEVRVRAGGRTVASRRVDLRQRFTAERLLLVLSRDADLDYLNDRGGKGLRVLYPHPELLPHRWQGYDAVAAVVLHGLSLESLSREQHEALRRWLARGGTLAVSGGPDHALLRTPRLAALLPATPVGLLPVEHAAAVGDALGAPLAAARTFHLNRVERVRGDVLREAAGAPLVIEARHGAGRVLYLTFDIGRYPFDRWSPMKDVWERLIDPAGAAPAPVHPPERRSVAPALLEARAPGFPGHGTLLVFMALYLSLLAVGYRLRAGARPRAALVAATRAVPLLFAPAAYLLFGPVLFERGASATVVSFVEPIAGSGHARLHVDLGLHANRRGVLRLEYDGVQPVFRAPAEARSRTGGGWVFSEGAVNALSPAGSAPYTLHLLEGEDTIPFALDASLSAGPPGDDGPRLAVRNASGMALSGAWLVHRGAAWFLGSIDGDGTSEHDLAREPDLAASERDEWWQALARDPRARAAGLRVAGELFARRADARDDRRYPGADHALLIGFTSSPLRLTGTSAGWRRTELSLVVLRMPAQRFAKPGEDDST